MIFVLCKNIGQEMIVAVASDTTGPGFKSGQSQLTEKGLGSQTYRFWESPFLSYFGTFLLKIEM